MCFDSRSMRNFAVVLVIGLALVRNCQALNCQPCELTECRPTGHCPFGTTKGVCGCCDVCGKGQGQECGGTYGILGLCAKGLECVPTERNPLLPPQFQEGKCLPGLVNDQPVEPQPVLPPAPPPVPEPQVKPKKRPISYDASRFRHIQPKYMRAPYKSGTSGLSGTFGRRTKVGLASPKPKAHKLSMSSSNIPPYILKLLQERKMREKMKNPSSTSLRKKRSPRLGSRKAGRSRLQAKTHRLNLYGMNIPPEVLERLRAQRTKRSLRLGSRKAGRSRLQAKTHRLNLSGMNIPPEVLERLRAQRTKRSPRLGSRKAGRSRLQAKTHRLNLSGMNIPPEVLERLRAQRTKRSLRLGSRKAGRSRLQAKTHRLNLSGMNIPPEVLARLKQLRAG